MTEILTPALKTLAGLPIRPVQERSPFLNILLYGDSGTGKTTLAGSADEVPSMRPVLFVDIEGGTESLRHSYPEVETIRVTTWREMQALYNELHRGNTGYQTVVLDSLTEIQKFNMYQIMADLITRKGEDDPKVDIDVPSMREWGKNLEQIRRFVRAFRDLPMHTIFTALAKSDKDQKTGIVSIKPSLSGKMADEVAAFLDVVVYYYVKDITVDDETVTKRLLLTRKTSQHVAKDRSGRLPVVVEAPTMATLNQLMYGKRDN
jgi:hypothetical protein